MPDPTAPTYEHLEPRPGSRYRQWFLKGRRIRAAVVHEVVHGAEPMTPEAFADDYRVPIEAVREALDYAERHRDLIEQEWRRDGESIRARGWDRPPIGDPR